MSPLYFRTHCTRWAIPEDVPRALEETAAGADRTRTGRGPHGNNHKNGRGPDAGSAVSPWTSLAGYYLPARSRQEPEAWALWNVETSRGSHIDASSTVPDSGSPFRAKEGGVLPRTVFFLAFGDDPSRSEDDQQLVEILSLARRRECTITQN
eukprot:gene18929-biopygen23453